MTSQQQADVLLAEHREARLRLSIFRSEQLRRFHTGCRNQGIPALEACELTAAHAKWLDDLELVKAEMEPTS